MCLSHEDGRNCDRETTPDCRALAFRASSGLRAGAQQLLGSLHHAFRRLTRATRHQRPALHTKITTAGVCDETASTGLHVGVNDANVEACLVLRDLFGSEEPENDPRLIRERVARRFCCRRSYAYILLRAALMSRARKHRSCRRFFLQGVRSFVPNAPKFRSYFIEMRSRTQRGNFMCNRQGEDMRATFLHTYCMYLLILL